MTVPVVAAFLKAHPKHKISVLTKKQFAPLFVHLKNVEVIGVDLNVDYKGFWGLIQLSKKIKSLKKEKFFFFLHLDKKFKNSIFLIIFL